MPSNARCDRYQLFGPPALQLFAPVVMSGRTFARLVKPTPRVFWNDCVKPTTECKACNPVAPGSRRQLADRSPPQHVLLRRLKAKTWADDLIVLPMLHFQNP